MPQDPTPEARHRALSKLAWDMIACSLLVGIGERRVRDADFDAQDEADRRDEVRA